jgi:uncharacterized membrane protein YdbT with pleckstrin-like domain
LPEGWGQRQDGGVTEERSLWKGSPSQWLNSGTFILALLLAAAVVVGAIFSGPMLPFVLIGLVVPVAWALWKYFKIRCQSYELTTERLKLSTGVINQHIDEIELYRVKDVLVVRPWWMRITGLASLILETSDRSQPHLTIPAVKGGAELREELRKQVEFQRDRKRVRETDFEEGGTDSPVL